MRPRVGLLGLTLDLYARTSPEMLEGLRAFSGELRETLRAVADVDEAELAWDRLAIEKAVARFDRDDVDLIVIVLLSYSTSLSAMPGLLRTRRPLLIWNTQKLREVGPDFGPDDITYNHGMHGVQDLCNVLLRHGREFHLITGHYQDPASVGQVHDLIRAAAAVRALRGRRIGLLGHTFDGMGDLYVDASTLLATTGVEVAHLSFAALARHLEAVLPEAVRISMARDRQEFAVDPDVSEEDHERSARLELAIRALIAEERLSALCALFTAATDHPAIRTQPFLAVSKLLAEGFGYGGEGDPTSATAVMLMQQLTRETNFAEMFTIDFAGGGIFMNHMAETNYRLGRPDLPVRLIRNAASFLPGEPSVCAFTVQKPGPVTLLNLTATAGGRLKMIGMCGEVADWGPAPGVRTPHFMFRPRLADGVEAFLTRYSLEGGSHHLALGYGDQRGPLRAAAKMMGIEWVEVTDL